MKQFQILGGKYNVEVIESFDEMTYKKAIKKIGKKYNDQHIILTYTNKHKNKVLHNIKKDKILKRLVNIV